MGHCSVGPARRCSNDRQLELDYAIRREDCREEVFVDQPNGEESQQEQKVNRFEVWKIDAGNDAGPGLSKVSMTMP